MERFRNLSFKNKILFSTIMVILLLSAAISVATRIILVPALTDELKRRGIGIAQSTADLSRGYILTEDQPNLVSLVFDTAQLGERRQLVDYIFLIDTKEKVLAHTFMHDFPLSLKKANPIGPAQSHAIRLVQVDQGAAYDIAVPIMEGIYQIGTVHVGLSKNHIDHLVGQLRNAFLGITFAILFLFFWISHWLSGYITRPISLLIKVSDEISRGNLDIEPDLGEMVYKNGGRAEMVQLAESFDNMTRSLKASQAQLRESEEKYRSLFDSGPDPIFVLDRKTLEILDANPSAVETYEYPKETLQGKSFYDLGSFEFKEVEESGGDKERGCPKRIVYPRVQHFKKGSQPFYVSIHGCPTNYKGREALIVATTDITEMIEKEAQLIQASKLTTLGEMSAGMAHELNQPLNAIKLGSEYLDIMVQEGREIPREDLLEVVHEISRQVDRAAEIINYLREFSRKAHYGKEKIDLNQPITGVFNMLNQQLSLQNIKLELELDKTIPPVWGHYNRFEQVIVNLVSNARDAIAQKKSPGPAAADRVIRIRTFQEDRRVVLEISDTGIGIPEPIREKIFQPFFTTKETGKGMGLGLSITYGIVRDYGGEIQVVSEEGLGTTFKLYFQKV